MASKTKEPATPAEVRAWAIEKGLTDKTRGRLSPAVREAYTKATKRPIA